MTETTDQAELHERIAVLLAETDGWEYAKGLGLRDMSESMQQHYDKLATAVLSVLPAPAVPVSDDLLAAQLAPLEAAARDGREQQRAQHRAEDWRKAAEICDEAGAVYASKEFNDQADAAYRLMERFLRLADEAEYVAAPCSAGGCEPGGEPCTTHERLMAHAEGDHELCAPDCAPASGPGRVAGETQQPETQARRGDAIEGWLKAQRDEYHSTVSPQWLALDDVLDTYRLHADTGTPLGGHVCEGRTVGNCDCLEPHLTPSGNVRIDHLLRAEQPAAVSQPETEA